jgi:acyl transferase domain-containing protein
MSNTNSNRPPLAVVGASALFPGSLDRTGFWSDILAGRDRITDVPATHWLLEDYYDSDPSAPDKTYARRGAFLGEVDFDALGWGVPPSIIPATDTAQLLALVVAQRVLHDAAKGQPDTLDRSRLSVILGVTSAQELLASMVSRLQRPVWVKSLREAGLPESQVEEVCQRISDHYVPWQESTFPGLLGNVVAGRIANRLDLGGTNCVTDAACASTFSALHMAANELYLGDSDMVVVGGVDTMNDIFMYMCFSKTPALSASGDVRPFSDQADGTMLGEGLGMVALKRLEDAERDGDRVYAVVRGVGSSSDGRSKSVYAPVSKGQASAIRRAYDHAGFDPRTVELVEAHGTGTKAGDAAEFGGLELVFGASEAAGDQDRQWCALGSVKSQIGHTKAAAGAAGLLKAVFAVHHKTLPPGIKIDKPNPKLQLEQGPFYLNTIARPWVRDDAHPRRAGVSSFGFGGSNFHVAVEEYTGDRAKAPRLRAQPVELVQVQAASAAELVTRARALADQLSEAGDDARRVWLQWTAFDSQQAANESAEHRLCLVAEDVASLRDALTSAADRIEGAPAKSFSTPNGTHYGIGAAKGSLAIVFPGQGSQYVGMGADLAMSYGDAIAVWDRHGLAIRDADAGETLAEHVFPRPGFDAEYDAARQRALTRTQWAQPAIVTTSLSMLALTRACGIEPAMVGGHSLGELTALHAGGVLSSDDVVALARRRGELMAEAVAVPGSMTAVRAEIGEVRAALDAAGVASSVTVANHNGPQQVVLSGTTEAIEAVEAKLGEEGFHCQRLPVATAFHSPVVADACGPLGQWLSDVDVAAPSLPVFSNARVEPYTAETDARASIASAVAQPVRFVEMIEAMLAAGARTFLEVGPGNVLGSLVKRIVKAADVDRSEVNVVSLDRKGKPGDVAFLDGIARLIAAGVAVDTAPLWAECETPVDPRTVAKAKLPVPITGSNYGKPYPPVEGAAGLPAPNPEPAPAPAIAAVPAPSSKPQTDRPPAAAPVATEPTRNPEPAPAAAQTPRAAAVAPVSSPARPVASTANAGSLPAGWLAAWQEAQAQTAEAHAAFQRAMADTHATYLQAAQHSFMGLAAMTGASASVPAPLMAPVAAPIATSPAVASAPSVPVQAHPESVAELHRLATAIDTAVDAGATEPWDPGARAAVAARAVAAPKPAAAAVAAPTPAPAAPTPVAAAPTVDLQALMLSVVAEQTGYPAEMLELSMDLEGDLGIDSIKRVEILSVVQERAPGMPEVDAGHMGTLRTLGEIVEYMQSLMGSVSASAPVAAAPVAAVAAAPAVDLHGLMLAVVAEQTGYPAEMLELSMDLEGDLGIDSIKRVEILSVVQERAPGMPEVDAGHMGTLRTLGEIVEYMQSLMGSAAAVPAPVAAAPVAAAPAVDLHALMLAVVAEQTGYPAEMLELSMDLEGDLGIDSIKRVEILSVVQERAPGMPEVDAGHMGTLRTLGEIVEYMQSLMGSVNAAVAPATAAAAEPTTVEVPTSRDDLGRYVSTLVDAPALGLAQPWVLGPDELVIIDGGSGVAAALVAQLEARGVRASAPQLLPETARAVVFLGGLIETKSRAEAVRVNRDAFALARAMAPNMTDGGLFVTVTADDGACGFEADATPWSAWASGLPALVKTAAQEWPQASVKAIGLDSTGLANDEVAKRLVDELLAGGPEHEVALSTDGRRRTVVSVDRPVERGQAAISAGDVVVVSGGARGVTAASIKAWARECQARFVLLGRTPLASEPASCHGVVEDAGLKRALLGDAKSAGETITPAELGRRVSAVLANREIAETLAELRAVGSEARYESVSVTDEARLRDTLARVRSEWGPIAGIVHGAGVLADKRIAEKTDAQFDRVFDTKVDGLAALLGATSDDPLRLLCTFSSVSARCGNNGQADYAMANEVLNKVLQSEARKRPECLVKSLGWGPWEGGMVNPALAAHFDQLGVPMIPLAVGARMLADELHGATPSEVELVMGGEPKPEALLFAGTENRELRMEVRIDRASHPYLVGHAIEGQTVVPVVLASEWMTRMAQAFRPDLALEALEDVKVLKGIRLDGFDGAGDRFVLRCSTIRNGDGALLRVTIESPTGTPHYRGHARMIKRSATPAGRSTTLPSVDVDAWGSRSPYDGEILFHRELFQVIDRLEGVGKAGARASLSSSFAGTPALASEEGNVLAYDGGLQLAVLWANHVLGGANLPTGIAEVRGAERLDGTAGPLQCILVGRESTRSKAVSDILFVDAGGNAVAELRGVENHLRPSSGS